MLFSVTAVKGLRACVFVLKHFFAKFRVLIRQSVRFFLPLAEAWRYTHWRRQFSTSRNQFSGVQGAQSRLGEHGPLNHGLLYVLCMYQF